MAKRRKHLSRAHRQAISRGLKRFHRVAKQKAQARSRAAHKAAVTRKLKEEAETIKRGARKVRAAEKKKAVAPIPAKAPVMEEWEVTIKYQKSGQLVAVSVIVFAPNPMPAGKPPTRDEVLGAVWRAANGHALTIMEVQAVDWRRERKGKEYLGQGTAIDLQSFKGMMFKSVLRAERVGD